MWLDDPGVGKEAVHCLGQEELGGRARLGCRFSQQIQGDICTCLARRTLRVCTVVGTQVDTVPRTGEPSPSSSQSCHHSDIGQWKILFAWATSRRSRQPPAGKRRVGRDGTQAGIGKPGPPGWEPLVSNILVSHG